MKNFFLLILFWGTMINRIYGQKSECNLVKYTFYFITIDIRSKNTNSIFMRGIGKNFSLSKLNIDSVYSLINSFYFQVDYVPSLPDYYTYMIKNCLGDSVAKNYIKNHKFNIYKYLGNIFQKSLQTIIRLKSGETVFLKIIKIGGSFWEMPNRNIMVSSNELQVSKISAITRVLVPFELTYFQKIPNNFFRDGK